MPVSTTVVVGSIVEVEEDEEEDVVVDDVVDDVDVVELDFELGTVLSSSVDENKAWVDENEGVAE